MLYFPNIITLLTNSTITAIGIVMYIIPIWNVYILYKITWGIGLIFLLMLIPVVGTIVALITSYKMAKVFGHGIGYALGLIFFPWLFWLVLGFGSSEYQGI